MAFIPFSPISLPLYRVRLFCSLCLCLILSGCQPTTPEAMLEDYISRLGNALGTDASLDLSDIHPAPLPRRRLRILEETPVRQGLLEVLELRQCDLLPLIAQRNSSLGRVMKPSQKLVYELKFIVLMRQCVDRIRTQELEPEVREQILNIWAIKQANLPAVLWNSLYNTDEMEANFSASEPPLELPSADISEKRLQQARFASVKLSLQHFQQLSSLASQAQNWPLPDFIDNIEEDYLTLYSNRFGSRWQRSLLITTTTLNQGANLIEQRLKSRPFCFSGHRNQQAEILMNVFQKYYAGQLQPYLANIHQQGDIWLAAHEAILTPLQSTLPDAMREYRKDYLDRQNQTGQWQQYRQALHRHTTAWQEILGQCNMMPDGSR